MKKICIVMVLVMGMVGVVFAEETRSIKIEEKQVHLSGVKTEPVRKLHLFKSIRTVGKVAYDPKLVVAEEEFISALATLDKVKQGNIDEIKKRTYNLVDSSKRKLELLGLSKEQINDLEKNRQVHRNLILPDNKMWVYGRVYEYELNWLKLGEQVKITTQSLPGEEFYGVVSSVNPVLDEKTRSVIFRAEIDNPGLKLQPEMYVDIIIESMYVSPHGEHMVLAIPKTSVLDTGRRKIVWVDKGNGRFEAREVTTGPEATAIVNGMELSCYPVLEGLNEEDMVVTKANFLIDSQSQITGAAAAAYGGALEGEEQAPAAPIHRH